MILEMLLTSSALILAVLLVRAVLGRKMGAGVRYGLWLLVLLRLLLPVSFGESTASPANLARLEDAQAIIFMAPIGYGAPGDLGVHQDPDTGALLDANSMGYAAPNADGTVTRYASAAALPDLLPVIWRAGMAAAAAWFSLCNLLFWLDLRRTRRLLRQDGNTRIYAAKTPSPCLFGLFHPSIYVTEAAAADEAALGHVLLHEKTHLRHGDHIWAFLRTVCLVVWWFNPLVWAAAAASRRDCELSCDASVIRTLGAENRATYGRTLLALAGSPRPVTAFCTVTTLSGGKGQLKQRIQAIARWARPRKWAIAAALLLALLAAGCAFTGGKEAPEAEAPADVSLTAEEALDALEASIAYGKNGTRDTVSFTVPEGYPKPEDWNIFLSGRALYSSQSDGSIHPLAGIETWKPGKTYSTDLPPGLTELYLTASLPWAEARELTLWPRSPSGVEPDFEALFAALAADPGNEERKAALRDIGPATVHYCFRYFLENTGCLDGLSWDDGSVPAVMLRLAESMLGGADMPLETDTMGEWWDEYVDLACRSFPEGAAIPEDGDMQLIWYLAQMVYGGAGSTAADGLRHITDADLITADGVALGMTYDEVIALVGRPDEIYDDPADSKTFRNGGVFYSFSLLSDGEFHLLSYTADEESDGVMPLGLDQEDTLEAVLDVLGADTEKTAGTLYGESLAPDSAVLRYGDDGLLRLHAVTGSGDILVVTFGRDSRIWLIECNDRLVNLPGQVWNMFTYSDDGEGVTILDDLAADDGAYGLLGAVLHLEEGQSFTISYCIAMDEAPGYYFYPLGIGETDSGGVLEYQPETFRYAGNGKVVLTVRDPDTSELLDYAVTYTSDGNGAHIKAESQPSAG